MARRPRFWSSRAISPGAIDVRPHCNSTTGPLASVPTSSSANQTVCSGSSTRAAARYLGSPITATIVPLRDPASPVRGEAILTRPMATYLIVAAHPDDAEFGAAGTAAALARAGHAVHYLMCTSGDAGSEDPGVSAEDLARTRETEQTEAGRILGLTAVQYLRYPDGELEPTLDLRKSIVRVMRGLKADIVLCQDPRSLVDDDSTYLNHPDHRAAGQAALDAAFPAAGNPSAFRDLLVDGLEPHKVREVWL